MLLQAGGADPADPSDPGRQMSSSVLYHCVSVSLTLLAPFMPFITEELWQRLQPLRAGAAARDSVCVQPYPRSAQLVRAHTHTHQGRG